MKQTKEKLRMELYTELTAPAFGYELLKNIVIPDILGTEAQSILYWAGRKLARQYLNETEEELKNFFDHAGWGELHMVEKNKKQMTYELSSDLIKARLKNDSDTVFTLEAGFIAETLQQQSGMLTEIYIEAVKDNKVIFIVKWDSQDQITY